ncbi:uncharacterized protein LTR77_010470 [Saxophila tyrrhenica]|uniref:non-specific serine/threonine protein kinase n=1 Tax=Saxophila tyrrhenica TaxID=1690608 RepID=A0AAV9NZD7_9PEZI|nr:hypothetical protein LTR77_010470 [Saxophila tyrrhenica]
MSSAAVQQQSTPQQYSQSDRYASDPNYTPSRRAGAGNASVPNTPYQQQSYSSPLSSAATMTTPRGPGSGHASPSEPLSNSTYQQFYPDSMGSGQATALPMRTSAQQAPSSATNSPYDSRGYSSRSQQAGYGSESERERGQRTTRSQADPASASRSSQQRSRHAPQQSRSTTAVGQTPMDTSLPREHSAIINHIVVDDPQADIARERARVQEAQPYQRGTEPGMLDQTVPAENEQKHRSRQEHLRQQPTNRSKDSKLGDYILGQTLGEGEFGKVKMGWKKDSTVQVAIKLIKKDQVQGNPTRLPKIYREIGILRDLQHPNIVRLHEFVETERHMGIILEYASGGELFDYILNHRYLKDPAARRLFAQLVSGVGYLHKKGIVHRDLKLENLLLDRNKNIIITDFGFANNFNPNDELDEETEKRIGDKDFAKRQGLDVVNAQGNRRGDLMQTSCGSPCYAAPELVVSDGLYTGRKVDVWSCGVILYAMLAGYLPFDDDPANPEGDNINLLYKYIVSTPLTFPEYVTPHARDLLRRILVPNPRLRADLFEVARHSWLSEYSHVVGFIGSSTKSDRDIASSAMRQGEEPMLGRSASVRDGTSRSPASAGNYAQKQPPSSADGEADARTKQQRDAKRRTVQLEYVAPKDQTARGETSPTGPAQMPAVSSGTGRTRARGDSQGPVEVPQTSNRDIGPQVPRKDVPSSSQAMPAPARPGRDQIRAASDSPATFSPHSAAPMSRPTTGGTLGSARLPSRGNSYGQPAIPASTNTNAQGHFSQPKSGSGYIISSPGSPDQMQGTDSRPISTQNLSQYQQRQSQPAEQQAQRGHKRSSTLGSIGDRILGRSSSRRSSQQQDPPNVLEKRDRRYPPVSMRAPMPSGNEDATPRQSMESSRRTSFGFNRKPSETPSESKRSSRRFSFLPNSFSLNNFSKNNQSQSPYENSDRPESKGMAFGRGASRSPSMSTTNSTIPQYYDQDREAGRTQQRRSNQQGSSGDAPYQNAQQGRYEKALPPQPQRMTATPPFVAKKQYRDDGYGGNLLDSGSQQQPLPSPGPNDPVERYWTPAEEADQDAMISGPYGNSTYNASGGNYAAQPASSSRDATYGGSSANYGSSGGGYESNAYSRTEALPQGPQVRAGNNRKFEYDRGHGGSSGPTRRVMDFFRRRGRDRGEV